MVQQEVAYGKFLLASMHGRFGAVIGSAELRIKDSIFKSWASACFAKCTVCFGALASRKRCDLKTRKRCDFYPAAQTIASDFSAISSAIFWRFFCDFCGKTCDLVLCDLKTQRFFCDCDFLGR